MSIKMKFFQFVRSRETFRSPECGARKIVARYNGRANFGS